MRTSQNKAHLALAACLDSSVHRLWCVVVHKGKPSVTPQGYALYRSKLVKGFSEVRVCGHDVNVLDVQAGAVSDLTAVHASLLLLLLLSLRSTWRPAIVRECEQCVIQCVQTAVHKLKC
jgi:hypothetical protein